MRLYKRKRNGFYYVEVNRNKGRSLKTKNYSEARKIFNALQQVELSKRLACLDGGKRVTLKEFEKKFFLKHSDIAYATSEAYRLAFKLLKDSIGPGTLLTRITESKINKFKQDCLARECRKTSINTYLRHIKGIFGKALEWNDINKKPIIKLYKIEKKHPRILNTKEREAILKYAKKNNFEMYRVIKFALYTGCRRAEIAGLTWQDVKKDSCYVFGKGSKERTISLVPGAWQALGVRKDIGFVFEHWNDLSKYTKQFKTIARECGIENIHFHHLRHSAASQMIESGIPIEFVQKQLGHANLSTTQIYVDIAQKKLTEQMQKLKYS